VIAPGRDADAVRLRRAALAALVLDLAGAGLIGLALRLPAARGVAPGPADLSVFLADDAGPSSAPDQAATPEPPVSAPPPVTATPEPFPEAVPVSAWPEPQAAVAREPVPGSAGAVESPPGPTAAYPSAPPEAGYLGEAADTGTPASELLVLLDALVRRHLAYPPLARQRNVEGVVELSLTVARDGSLGQARLARSSGSAILDRAARALMDKVFPLQLTAPLREPLAISINIVYALDP